MSFSFSSCSSSSSARLHQEVSRGVASVYGRHRRTPVTNPPSADMSGGTEVHLSRNCKIVHLVDELSKHLNNINLTQKIELVVTSPLMRAMQTAVGAFGGPQHIDGDPLPPLMVANSGGSTRPAISSSGCPPIMAVELCRARLGLHPCDKGQPISTYRNIFPGIDFSQIERDEDILWKPDVRETSKDLIARGKKFLEWLSMRKEREIAVVSHSGFLTHLMSAFGEGCSRHVQGELRKGFTSCEMRSIVLVNQRELGDPIAEDYHGGSPPGPDVPSEDVEERVIENGL